MPVSSSRRSPADQTTGLPIVFRKWAPGTDPASQGDGVIDGKAKALAGGSSKDAAGLGPQNAPESAQGQGPSDTAGHHGTTPSADPSNPAPVSPLGRAPWLFQKGNRYGQRRKPHQAAWRSTSRNRPCPGP